MREEEKTERTDGRRAVSTGRASDQLRRIRPAGPSCSNGAVIGRARAPMQARNSSNNDVFNEDLNLNFEVPLN